VDDEALIVVLTASWLEDLGCEVETAFNGSQALTKLWNDRHFEVLITDVNMPGISGYQLAERAKEMRPELKVIMLSGAETDPHGWPLVRKPFLIRPNAGDLRRRWNVLTTNTNQKKLLRRRGRTV
jgi:two-component system, cell cycle response regulator CpdR